jgi:hypothetical protein
MLVFRAKSSGNALAFFREVMDISKYALEGEPAGSPGIA